MKLEVWNRMISALPQGLTVEQAAKVFRRSPRVTRQRLLMAGYSPSKKRGVENLPARVINADWTLPNVVLARRWGLSRERVRQYRNLLGHPKVECRGKRNPKQL